MQNAEYILANFRLSKRAAAKLVELATIATASTSRSMVPALFWGDDYDEIKREHVVLGLAMGWYYLDEVPAKLLQEVDGVTLIFAVTSKQAQHFLAREIDYQDEKRFFLVP
jgi:hypothetical protein